MLFAVIRSLLLAKLIAWAVRRLDARASRYRQPGHPR